MSGEGADFQGGNDGGQETGQNFLSELQAEREQLRNEIAEMRRSSESTNAVLSQLQKAFSGGKEQAPQQGWYDQFLDGSLQALARGVNTPMTAALGMGLKEADDRSRRHDEMLAKMQQKLASISNPVDAANRDAYREFDGQIGDTIRQVYGFYDEHMANYVTNQLENIVRDLQDPRNGMLHHWEHLMRSGSARQGLINEIMERAIPLRARERLMDQFEDEAPITAEVLSLAREAARDLEIAARQGVVNPRLAQAISNYTRQRQVGFRTSYENRRSRDDVQTRDRRYR